MQAFPEYQNKSDVSWTKVRGFNGLYKYMLSSVTVRGQTVEVLPLTSIFHLKNIR